MATYISRIKGSVTDIQGTQLNNQVIISGNNQSHLVASGIFFIEHFEAATGTTITITDGNGIQVATGASYFSSDRSPIRCDNGIVITGNVAMLKGFAMESIVP